MTNPSSEPIDTAAFQAAFAAPLTAWKDKRVCVALSGGLDSVVLLHLLCATRKQLGLAALSALHVHHGLQAAADSWPDFCAHLCRQWQVDFVCERVQVAPQRQGIEAAARQARYAAFARPDTDIVALAHHADDQAETFLLAALRGGGVRALAAMPSVRQLSKQSTIELWRPLLPFSRAQLAAYAAAQSLSWVEDPSNADVSLLRNRVRRLLLPELSAQVPQATAHFQAAVAVLQDEKAVLDEVAEADWAAVHACGFFDRIRWRQLSAARRRQLLRRFAEHHNLGLPRRAALTDWEQVLSGHADTGEWRLPHGRAMLYRNRLFALPAGFEQQFGWLNQTPYSGSLKTDAQRKGIIWRQAAFGLSQPFINGAGSIRAARADDVLQMANGRKAIKKLLQEQGVPPFMRPLWPVVADEHDRCVAVVNLRVGADGIAGGWLPECCLLDGFQAT